MYDHPPEVEGLRAIRLIGNEPASEGAKRLTRLRDRVFDAFDGLLDGS